MPGVVSQARGDEAGDQRRHVQNVRLEPFRQFGGAQIFQEGAMHEAEQVRPAQGQHPVPLLQSLQHLFGRATGLRRLEAPVVAKKCLHHRMQVGPSDSVGAQTVRRFLHAPGDPPQQQGRVAGRQIAQRAVRGQFQATPVIPVVAQQLQRLGIQRGTRPGERLVPCDRRHDRQDHRVAGQHPQLRPPLDRLAQVVARPLRRRRLVRKHQIKPDLGEIRDLLRRQVGQGRDLEAGAAKRVLVKAGDAGGDQHTQAWKADRQADDLLRHLLAARRIENLIQPIDDQHGGMAGPVPLHRGGGEAEPQGTAAIIQIAEQVAAMAVALHQHEVTQLDQDGQVPVQAGERRAYRGCLGQQAQQHIAGQRGLPGAGVAQHDQQAPVRGGDQVQRRFGGRPFPVLRPLLVARVLPVGIEALLEHVVARQGHRRTAAAGIRRDEHVGEFDGDVTVRRAWCGQGARSMANHFACARCR